MGTKIVRREVAQLVVFKARMELGGGFEIVERGRPPRPVSTAGWYSELRRTGPRAALVAHIWPALSRRSKLTGCLY
jgi:hypothetical protein